MRHAGHLQAHRTQKVSNGRLIVYLDPKDLNWEKLRYHNICNATLVEILPKLNRANLFCGLRALPPTTSLPLLIHIRTVCVQQDTIRTKSVTRHLSFENTQDIRRMPRRDRYSWWHHYLWTEERQYMLTITQRCKDTGLKNRLYSGKFVIK